MLGSRYLRILRRPRTAPLLVSALAARIPDSIAATALVVLVRSVTGSYSTAGVAAGASGIGTAVSAPLTGRAVDRLGQRRVLPVLAAAFAWTFAVITLGMAAGSAVSGIVIQSANTQTAFISARGASLAGALFGLFRLGWRA